MLVARLACLGVLTLAACASPTHVARVRPQPMAASEQAWQPDWPAQEGYGFSPTEPIHVGGGPEGQHAFLDSLRGPEGQALAWRRLGSCCEFETPNSLMGLGLLDMYEVIYEGQERSAILYLDMYDAGPVEAPSGFVLSPEETEPQQEQPVRQRPKHPSQPKVIEL